MSAPPAGEGLHVQLNLAERRYLEEGWLAVVGDLQPVSLLLLLGAEACSQGGGQEY